MRKFDSGGAVMQSEIGDYIAAYKIALKGRFARRMAARVAWYTLGVVVTAALYTLFPETCP